MRRYDCWTGNPTGTENKDLCVASVSDGSTGWHNNQCRRKRGHGPDSLYCKQHAKMVAEGKHVFVPEEE